MENLILLSEEASVTAYQIGFDLYENATQQFLHSVTDALSKSEKIGHLIEKPKSIGNEGSDPKKPEETAISSEESTAEELKTELSNEDKAIKKRLELLNSILSGDKVCIL